MKIEKSLYAHRLGPIDYWEGWTPLANVLRISHPPADDPWLPVRARFPLAQKAARRAGWDGIIRGGMFSEAGGPWIAPLPMEDWPSCDFMIGFKQDNNGSTFIVSPVELPWLGRGERLVYEVEEVDWDEVDEISATKNVIDFPNHRNGSGVKP